MDTLDPPELHRYGRQLNLAEVGLDGQLKLKRARVLVLGTGGLGSPAALYLAAAGVGTLGLVDFDSVDVSNLQRQILFRTGDAGEPKARLAAERLRELNPRVATEVIAERFSSKNARRLVSRFDVIVDATDNFETRYLVSDACVLEGRPLVHGAVQRFEGRVSVFDPARGGPCYRCLFPEPPPEALIPNCAEAGVLGALPGVVGAMQATETLKLLLGIGLPLSGRLLCLDALEMRGHELAFEPNPSCAACGPGARAALEATLEEIEIRELSFAAFARWPRDTFDLLDVRTAEEHAAFNLGGRLIPLAELPRRLAELEPGRRTLVHCATGARSLAACRILRRAGFVDVWNLQGGLPRHVRVDHEI